MATFDITVDAQSAQGDGASGSNVFTEPGDFDGATIDDVSVVGSPTVTSDGITNDTIGVRFNIETSTGTDIWGGVGSDAASACSALLGDSVSSDIITDGSAPSPAPGTAVAADWDQVAFLVNYAKNGKDDAELVSWSSFTIRVTYTPSGTAFTQDVEGTLTFVGAQTRITEKNTAGVLSFVGDMFRRTNISPDGTLTFGGVLTKETQKLLAGVVSFDGALTSIIIFTQDVEGTLTFVGDISKNTFKRADGNLTFSGDIAKQINKELAGTLSFTGVINKLVNKSLAGELSFIGNLVASIIFSQAVIGALSFIGGLATLFIPPVGITIRLMWRSLWGRVWKDPGKKDEDN